MIYRFLLALVLLVCAPCLQAQNAQQFFDSFGKPVSRGTVTFYQADPRPQGVLLAPIYRDGRGRRLDNPVRLDSKGRASIWLDHQNYYIVLRNRDGVPLATYRTIWTSPDTYWLDAVSCVGKTCLPDGTKYFPVRKP